MDLEECGRLDLAVARNPHLIYMTGSLRQSRDTQDALVAGALD